MTGKHLALLAGLVLVGSASGCAGLVEAPPSASPKELAPAVQADAPAARGISAVRVPALSRDGFVRRAREITVRVRNLSCEGVALGSGFVIDGDTLITNRHVVAGADMLEVDTADGRTFEVSAAEVGVLGDVAFVTVDGSLPVIADLDGVAKQGSEVSAVGYPLGGPFTISKGVVVDEVDGYRFGVQGPVLRVTADVQHGNSGGPLLDARGRVAGVVYAIETATGFGMAIPMDTVHRLLEVGGTTSVPSCGYE
jgi:S1-C subfamily serine protease